MQSPYQHHILLIYCLLEKIIITWLFQFQLFQLIFWQFHYSLFIYIFIYILISYIFYREKICPSKFNWNNWNWNIFVKSDNQSQTCLNFGMTRKCRLKANRLAKALLTPLISEVIFLKGFFRAKPPRVWSSSASTGIAVGTAPPSPIGTGQNSGAKVQTFLQQNYSAYIVQ